jgi:CheY-like chemotaxis protein
VERGSDALPKARELCPDVVIADLSLSDKDGYEICRELRADDALGAVPVLLLHGPAVEYDAGKADAVRASGEVAKPFESTALLEKVSALAAAK